MKPIKPKLTKAYSKGSYNKCNSEEQWIRITEGCPNKCAFCRESFENGIKPIYLPIPEIVRNKVKIMDMNLTAKSKAKEIIEELGSKKVNGKVVYYELVCGVDYRFLIQDVADALYKNRFKNIRIAWDHQLTEQKEIKKSIEMLLKAGYSRNDIMVFMICNWLIPYETNLRKMDLCKIWNVKIGDCYFDNQTFPNCKPIHWDIYQLKDFRMRVRKHNQMVNFGIDPELKEKGFFQTQADYRRSLNRNLIQFATQTTLR